jgi:hypothetical protein
MIENERAVLVSAPQADRPFDVVMGIWAQFMRLKDSKPNSHQPLDQDAKEFMALGEAVTVMMDDLTRVQRWAIMRSRGICTVWIFPNTSMPDALADAEETLMPKLQKHVATKRYFN